MEQGGDADGFQLRLRGPRKTEHFLHDAFEAGDFAADDFGVLAGQERRVQVLVERVEAGLDGGKRVADFVRDAGGERAERGEFFLFFQDGLALHEFGAQRSYLVAVEDDAERRHEREHESHAAKEERAEVGQRMVRVAEKGFLRHAMRVGQLSAELEQALRLALEFVELREALGGDERGLPVRMHLPAGGHVAVVGVVELLEQLALAAGGELRGFVEARVVLVNPAVEVRAGLLELRPCRRFAPRGVAHHGVVEVEEALLKFPGEAEAFEMAGGEFALQFRDATP